MKTNRTLRIVSAILLVVMVMGIFSGCARTSEEEFQSVRERVLPFENETSKEAAQVLKEKLVSCVEENGVQVVDSVMSAAPAGTGNYIGLVVLTESKVVRYEIAGNSWTATKEEIDNLSYLVNGLYRGEEDFVEYTKTTEFELDGNKFKLVSN